MSEAVEQAMNKSKKTINGTQLNSLEDRIRAFIRRGKHLFCQEGFGFAFTRMLEKENLKMFVDGVPVTEDTEITFAEVPVIPKPTYKELEARIKELEGKA